MIPPDSASATISSSGFIRLVGHSDRDPAWLIMIGTRLASMASKVVRSPACAKSGTMPTSFILPSTARPCDVSPSS